MKLIMDSTMSAISIPEIHAHLEKFYQYLIEEDFDLSDAAALKERLRAMYNASSECAEVTPNRLTGALNHFIKKKNYTVNPPILQSSIQKFDDNEPRKRKPLLIEDIVEMKSGKDKYTENNSYRRIYLNATVLYRKLIREHVLENYNTFEEIKRRMIFEYTHNSSYGQPVYKPELEYIIMSLMLRPDDGYAFMEELDENYGYKGNISSKRAMNILFKQLRK